MNVDKLETAIHDELVARCNAEAKAQSKRLDRCKGFGSPEWTREHQGMPIRFKRYGIAAELKMSSPTMASLELGLMCDKHGTPIALNDRCAMDLYPDSRGPYVYRLSFDKQQLCFVLECKENRHRFRMWQWNDDLTCILNIEKMEG